LSISNRLRKLERRFDKGSVKIYLEDGSVIKKDKKEILHFIVGAIEANITESGPQQGQEFLLQVAEDDRNDKAVLLAKSMLQNRQV